MVAPIYWIGSLVEKYMMDNLLAVSKPAPICAQTSTDGKRSISFLTTPLNRLPNLCSDNSHWHCTWQGPRGPAAGRTMTFEFEVPTPRGDVSNDT